MSIGRGAKDQEEIVPTISRLSFSAKKVVSNYFEKPAHYLFYGMIFLGAIALLVGRDPSVKYWILLGLVGALKMLNSSTQIRVEGKEVKSPSKKSRHDNRTS